MKLKVLGLATDNSQYVQNWAEGLEYAGLDFEVLGLGEKYTGHKMKSEKFHQAMVSQPDIDIFILSDTYDVLINKDLVDQIQERGDNVEEYIIDIFLRFKTPILVGAEKACLWCCVDFNALNFLNVLTDNHRFLNSGLMMGRREYMISLCQMMMKYKDDQLAVGYIRKQHPKWFSLDVKSKLFYNNYYDINPDRLNKALFLHFPGVTYHQRAKDSYNSMERYDSVNNNLRNSPFPRVLKIILLILIIVLLCMMYLILRRLSQS